MTSTGLSKQCSKCQTTKAIEAFGMQHGRRRSHCKPCVVLTGAAWVAANREAHNASARARHAARPEVAAASQHTRRQRGPLMPWYDRALVRDIYKLARLHREAGIDCHVDHIVPLAGATVSGLHVPANLTLLLAEHNRAKGSRQWPDMPHG